MTALAVSARYTVRDATLVDIPWLLVEARAFADSFGSRLPLWPGDEAAAAWLSASIERDPVFVAVTDDGAGVGFLLSVLAPHYFNPALLTLSELAWWVAPAHRGSRAGLLLLDAFCACGAEHATWTTLSLETTSRVNERTLAKRGFRLFERAYLREEGLG